MWNPGRVVRNKEPWLQSELQVTAESFVILLKFDYLLELTGSNALLCVQVLEHVEPTSSCHDKHD